MIIVSLFGGLGNQLFQYACGKTVADKLGVELYLDTTLLMDKTLRKNFTNREFELNLFNVDAKIAEISEIRKYVPNLFNTPKWYHQIFRIRRFFNGRSLFIERVWQRHTYIPSIENVKDNTYLYGYFQTEKFFEKNRKQLLNSIQLNSNIAIDKENQKIISQIQNEESVSIHVRRGDYADSRFILLEMDYYLKAIEKIKKNISNPTFYIFSNDVEWVKNYFSNLDIQLEIIDINRGEKSFLDLILMSKCKHNIIANSSFSWWGAWLNQNSEKIIIAPQNWYKNISEGKDLIPDEWNKI